jgi:3-mercaptopyruvate sulfurtransferase SseA
MKNVLRIIIVLTFAAAVSVMALAGGEPDLSGVERVTPEYVSQKLDDPNVVIVDVRRMGDMIPPQKIPGARVENWEQTSSWSDDVSKDKEIITYCA